MRTRSSLQSRRKPARSAQRERTPTHTTSQPRCCPRTATHRHWRKQQSSWRAAPPERSDTNCPPDSGGQAPDAATPYTTRTHPLTGPQPHDSNQNQEPPPRSAQTQTPRTPHRPPAPPPPTPAPTPASRTREPTAPPNHNKGFPRRTCAADRLLPNSPSPFSSTLLTSRFRQNLGVMVKASALFLCSENFFLRLAHFRVMVTLLKLQARCFPFMSKWS